MNVVIGISLKELIAINAKLRNKIRKREIIISLQLLKTNQAAITLINKIIRIQINKIKAIIMIIIIEKMINITNMVIAIIITQK